MAQSGMTMQGLSAMAIGVLSLIVAFTVIPIVGDQLDNAITIPGCTDPTNETGCSTGYHWNATINTDIPTGYGLWESLGGIFKVGGVVVVVAGFLRTLQGLRT